MSKKLDSKMLAHLLRADLVAESTIPPREIRDLRERLRFRFFLVQEQTMIRNKVHALVEKTGYQNPYKGWFGKKSLSQLKQQAFRPCYQYP